MRFDLRPRVRLPVVIFAILIAGSILTSFAVINLTIAAHLEGDYLRLETEYLELEFPKDWFAANWEEKNESSGNSYVIVFFPPDTAALMSLRVQDEISMRTFMNENNLTDAYSVLMYNVDRIYNWSLQKNSNATLTFVENGTITVSGCKADYTKITITEGIKENEVFYDLTSMFITCMVDQQLAQIAFWGKKEDWDQAWDTFQTILNSTSLKVKK